MTPNLPRRSRFWFSILTLLVVACNTKHPKESIRNKSRVSIANAILDKVVPLADGGAYVQAIADGVWYVVGNTATKVKVIGDTISRHHFESAMIDDIQPTIDGGAYAYAITGGIWRLSADSAFPVTEGPKLTGMHSVGGSSEARFLWAIYSSERSARNRVERRDYSSDDNSEGR